MDPHGFIYVISHRRKTGNRRIDWVCANFRRLNCKGRATTIGENIVRMNELHDHEPLEDKEVPMGAIGFEYIPGKSKAEEDPFTPKMAEIPAKTYERPKPCRVVEVPEAASQDSSRRILTEDIVETIIKEEPESD